MLLRFHVFQIQVKIIKLNGAKIYPTPPPQKAPYLVSHLVKVEGVPYTLSDNRIMQNYWAFSRITGNSKQGFMLTKSKNSNSRGRKIDLYQGSRIKKKRREQSRLSFRCKLTANFYVKNTMHHVISACQCRSFCS